MEENIQRMGKTAMTKSEHITLFDAVQEFMGQIHASAGRILDEGADDDAVTVTVCGYPVEMTLATLKRLDRAYMHAHEAKLARSERKHRGGLLAT